MKGTYKEIEDLLYQYKMLYAEHENLNRIYEEKGKDIGSGIDTTREFTGKTNKFSSFTENLAVELADYKSSISKLKMQLDIIDTSLNALSEREKMVVELKCIEDLPWWKVSYQVGFSDKWCKVIKKDAINKLITSIPIEVFC